MSIEHPSPPAGSPNAPGQSAAPPRSEDFKAALGRSRVAAIAFFTELLILVAIVVFLGRRLRLRFLIQERASVQVFRIVLFAAAAASVILGRINNGRAIAFVRKAGSEPEKLGRLNRASLSTLAASMIPAVIGFVLYLLAGQVRDFYILAFVSLLLLFFYFPRPAPWEAALSDRGRICPM